MPQTNLGRVAFIFKGDYNPATIYTKYDVVFDGESSYVSKIDNNVGNALANALNWTFLCRGSFVGLATLREDVGINELPVSEALNLMYNKLIAIEKQLSEGVFGSIQVDQLTTIGNILYKGAPLIITGTTAPSIIPDFEGQKYINISGGVTYDAKGVSSTSDWKQTSN